jgi:hypothetical protein
MLATYTACGNGEQAGRGGSGGSSLKSSVLESLSSAGVLHDASDSQRTGACMNAPQAHDLPYKGARQSMDAGHRNSTEVDLRAGACMNAPQAYDLPYKGARQSMDGGRRSSISVENYPCHPSTMQDAVPDGPQRNPCFSARHPLSAVDGNVPGADGSMMFGGRMDRAASISKPGMCTRWQGMPAVPACLARGPPKDQAYGFSHGHGHNQAHSGVHTPPQMDEARSVSRGGRPGGHPPTGPCLFPSPSPLSCRQFQQPNYCGPWQPSNGFERPASHAEKLISPFACASMNRSNSSSSVGVPTPEKGESRRTSFE